jgi:integration host factor subunit beta
MNKIELADQLRQSTGITKPMAQKVVKIFFESMTDALAKGERVEIRGLCSFFVKNYPSYVGRNPKTGKKIDVKPKKLPFFKVGKGLKELLNEADTRNQSTNGATRPIDP